MTQPALPFPRRSKRSSIDVMDNQWTFEVSIDEIARLKLDIATLAAARDEEKEAILERYDNRIKAIEAEIKDLQTQAAAYAQINWERLAPRPGAKSATTTLASYGFRTGTPALKCQGKRTQSELAAELHAAGQTDYVTVKVSLNKPAIIRAVNAGVEMITRLFTVSQTERFFVEAKAQD